MLPNFHAIERKLARKYGKLAISRIRLPRTAHPNSIVIPAKAGIQKTPLAPSQGLCTAMPNQNLSEGGQRWIPAFAGMTVGEMRRR